MRTSVQIFLAWIIFQLALPLGTCGTITNVQLGEHQDYTVLVISLDQDVKFEVNDNGPSVSVFFQRGTVLGSSITELSVLKDNLIEKVSFNPALSEIEIRVRSNYELKVLSDRFPFRIILDFTHLPGIPQSEDIESPVNSVLAAEEQEQSQKEKEVAARTIQEPYSSDGKIESGVNRVIENEAFKRGIELERAGDYQGALKSFLVSAPYMKGEGHYRAALIYKRLNQSNKAIKELNLAIIADPSSVSPRIELARTYQAMGKLDKAEQLWEEFLSTAKLDTSINFNQLHNQVDLMAALLPSQDEKIADLPIVDNRTLPKIPWNWIFFCLLLVVIIVVAKLYSSWRFNRLYESIAANEDEEIEKFQIDTPSFSETQENRIESQQSDFEYMGEDEGDFDYIRAIKAISVPSLDSEDENEDRIYKLAKRNYSVPEIARILDMGQEEVKFILEFHTQTEF